MRIAVVVAVLALTASLSAQPPQGRGGPPPTGRAGAPVDLTGTWVSVVTEDWEARMMPPVKGVYTTVETVMTPEARKVADTWQPSMEGRCEAYGVGGVMRVPGPVSYTHLRAHETPEHLVCRLL